MLLFLHIIKEVVEEGETENVDKTLIILRRERDI